MLFRSVEAGGGPELSFEELTQVLTDPPFYIWKINGQEMKFFTEEDLISQDRFRRLSLRHLHVLPPRKKDPQWSAILNQALENLTIREVERETDISPGAQFHDLLFEFFERQTQAEHMEQILLGKVYKDKVKGEYVFQHPSLIRFLYDTKRYRDCGLIEVQDKLKGMGAVPRRQYISDTRKTVRVWALPVAALQSYLESDGEMSDEFEITFSAGDLDAKTEEASPAADNKEEDVFK